MATPINYYKYKNLTTKERREYILEVATEFEKDIMNLGPIDGEKIFTFNKTIKDEETEK